MPPYVFVLAILEPHLRDQTGHLGECRRDLIAQPAELGVAQIVEVEIDDLDVHRASVCHLELV